MSGIAYDDGIFWVATYYPDPGMIYQINQNGEVISEISSPDEQPWDISIGDMGLWVVDYWGDAIYAIDKNNGNIISSHASEGVDPAGVVWDGDYLWYCDNGLDYNTDLLYKVDLSGSGTPVIDISNTDVSFGDVEINTVSEVEILITNLGSGELILESYQIPNSNIYLELDSLS